MNQTNGQTQEQRDAATIQDLRQQLKELREERDRVFSALRHFGIDPTADPDDPNYKEVLPPSLRGSENVAIQESEAASL